MKEAPYPRRTTTPPGETVSHDTSGPYTLSNLRETYLHFIVHNKAGKIFAQPMTRKSDAESHIGQTLAAIKTNHGDPINRVHFYVSHKIIL